MDTDTTTIEAKEGRGSERMVRRRCSGVGTRGVTPTPTVPLVKTTRASEIWGHRQTTSVRNRTNSDRRGLPPNVLGNDRRGNAELTKNSARLVLDVGWAIS
jgi:hypothetical protein